MAKLRRILGEEKLDMIRLEKPELYAILMEYVNSNKSITAKLCRELLAEFNLTFNVEADLDFHKKLREKQEAYGFGDADDDSYFRNSNSVSRAGGERETMNKTSNSTGRLDGASGKNTANNRAALSQPRKKNNMF